MPDLNLNLDFFTHPKTMRLIGLLGRAAEVLPIRLWAYCGKHFAEDGRLTDHSPQEIESLIGWWGKEGAAVEAMVKVGFMEKVKNGYQVHDWKDYQGHIGAMKERNRKVAINRWKNLRKSMVTVDTSGIPRGNHNRDPGIPHPSLPSNQPTNEPKVVDSTRIGKPQVNGNDTSQAQETLERAIAFSGDDGSRAFYQKAIRALGPGLVEEAVAEVRMRFVAGAVHDKSRYLTRLLTDWMVARGVGGVSPFAVGAKHGSPS